MRGYNYYLQKIREYHNHNDMKTMINDIRNAMKELDNYNQFLFVYDLVNEFSQLFHINDILSFICSKPDLIEFSDVLLCLACLCCAFADGIHTKYIVIIIDKFPNTLHKLTFHESLHPLSNTCCFRSCDINIIKALIRGGIPLQGDHCDRAIADAFRSYRLDIVDYLLEMGAKVPKKVDIPDHTFFHKRRACKEAAMAVYGVFLKRCKVNRDVARNVLKPMIWETRMHPEWDNRERKRFKK